MPQNSTDRAFFFFWLGMKALPELKRVTAKTKQEKKRKREKRDRHVSHA
jgi:hypothetical protein